MTTEEVTTLLSTETDVSTEYQELVIQKLDEIRGLQTYETGFSLFFVLVILLVFTYKFFNLFF